MDDSEYYRKMREQYSHTTNMLKKNLNSQYAQWNAHQGREDAQMLQEKGSEGQKPVDQENNEDDGE